MLLYDLSRIIESSCGVQQGDPLAPLYFCCGINGLVNEIQKLNPVYNKWYMDDGGIIGDVETLQQAWKIIQERGPEMGLYLNPSKCEWTWLDPECKDLCPIQLKGVAAEDQVKLVPHDHIEMLGVPLGSVKFNSEFVEKKLMKRLSRTVTDTFRVRRLPGRLLLAAGELQHRAGSALHADHATGALAGPRQELRQADAQGGGDHPRHSLARTLRTNSLVSPPSVGGMGMRRGRGAR